MRNKLRKASKRATELVFFGRAWRWPVDARTLLEGKAYTNFIQANLNRTATVSVFSKKFSNFRVLYLQTWNVICLRFWPKNCSQFRFFGIFRSVQPGHSVQSAPQKITLVTVGILFDQIYGRAENLQLIGRNATRRWGARLCRVCGRTRTELTLLPVQPGREGRSILVEVSTRFSISSW